MGYIFLSISLLAGVLKGYCGKRTSGYITEYKDAVLASILRMFLCFIIGAVLVISSKSTGYIKPDLKLMAVCALSGISTSVFVVCWLVSVKKGAYMMLDVFLMLGVLVPVLGGYTFFNEAVKASQWIGMGILLIAVIIMCSYNNSIKEKLNIYSLLLLMMCGISNGITDFSQKLFVKNFIDIPIAVFNLYTYIFSAITLVAVYFVLKMKKRLKYSSDKNTAFEFKKIFIYILVMSVCLFVNSFFKTKAAVYLDSARLYPLNQGSALILSSVMSSIFFKEKLTGKCVLGLIISFAGLIIINVL